MADPHPPSPDFNPAAAIFAWLWPEAGHIFVGERRRGLYIMAGVLFLVFSGLLIGGIDSVDKREDRLWFIAQAANGPVVFGVDLLNQAVRKAGSAEDQLRTTSFGRPNELGTLFIALAGLMNAVVILDAAFYHPRGAPEARHRRSDDRRRSTDPPGEATS